MTDQTVHHDHYQYQSDPNLSSAAQYSPSRDATTEYTTSVTYSNLIFVPNSREGSYHHGNTNAESVTTLLDHSQAAYVLSSDSRQYNTDSKNAGEEEDGDYMRIKHHNHHQQQLHQYSSDDIDGMSHAQHLNTVDNYHIQEEYVETSDGNEIILQGPNGEFYRQVQNVYLDDGNGGTTSTVEILPIIDDDQYVDNGSGQQQHHYQSIFKVEEIHHHSTKTDNMVLHLPSVADAELLVSSSAFGQYKTEYTVLEPMNRQLLPEAQQQYLVEISNHAEEGMRPVQSLTMDEKEQQRILLESTMSPLLAAVNDITARDEQLQDFLARSSFKEELMLEQSSNTEGHHHNYLPPTNYPLETIIPQQAKNFPTPLPTNQNSLHSDDTAAGFSNDLKITNVRSVTNEYVDINDMEFVQHRTTGCTEFTNNDTSHENLLVRRSQRRIKKQDDLMVSDKPVPSRAWASLPTAFLHITKGTLATDDYNIFAKKDIPLRTKFGPYKGDIKTLTPNERKVLESGENRRLPLLLLDNLTMLDTSNEYTSNWMRFVRLASTFTEQNLLLFEIEQQLYFQTCQPIAPKQQLSVGYGQAYAERYGLPFLQPSAAEKVALYERWPCFECDKKFETFELLQTHLNAQHEDCASGPNVSTTPGKRPYTKVNRTRRRRTVRTKLSVRKVSGPTVRYACCYCSKVFSKLIGLKRHNELAHSFVDAEARNGSSSVLTNSTKENAGKTNKCEVCRRYFSSTERLEKHRLMHCKSHESKLVQCTYCPKQVLTQSALAMHVKSHIFKSRLFHCLYCSERFQHAAEIMGHVPLHMENGFYNCERCQKTFKEYTTVRKHFRSIHSNVLHSCPDCGRDFKSMHKLKQHRLSHSDVREFLCSDCGKQFKRKDKLREHIISIHVKAAKEQEQQQQDHTLQIKPKTTSDDLATEKESSYQQNCPKQKDPLKAVDVPISNAVSPSDYQRFIYKCHDCQLGFKRRGMLVNHMAKRHPQVSIDSVPELNLPILKAQRYYYCQYCDKVYKSSSKRKAHILKYHPGMDLPMSSRQKCGQPPEVPGLPNASYSETVGNVTTNPQRCAWCHKQYASKARLLQHQRKQHTEHLREIEMYNQQDMEFGVDGMPDESDPNDGYIDHHGHFLTTMPTRCGYETENKLLKLSSAALEASLKDDFHFYDDKGATTVTTDVHQQSQQHHNHHSTLDELGDAVLSKVDVNFKVVGTDYVDTTSSSGDLNRLPQLFDEIDYMTLKPVSVDHYHNNHHQNLHLHLHQQQQHLVTPENPAKKLSLAYTHNTG